MSGAALTNDVMVEEIEDDVLLGYDILVGGDGWPADILLSQNKIFKYEVDIPIFQIAKEKAERRVAKAKDVNLPEQSEAVVSFYVKRVEGDDSSDSSSP